VSQANVDIVLQSIEFWKQGIAGRSISSPRTSPTCPTTGWVTASTTATQGVIEWFVEWRREWTDYELDVERVEDLGDAVLTIERSRATGKRSGVPFDQRTGSIWTRDGKIVRWQGFASPEEALEAAGVAE
jgi:ketosteroid isomerase-like protein